LAAGIALLIGVGVGVGVGGCGAPAGNSGMAAGNGAVQANAGAGAAAAPANLAAPAGNASAAAETPVGPCPFQTRGWTAEVSPPTGNERPSVGISGEARPDRTGRRAMIWTLSVPRPPAYVMELQSDATMTPDADRSWMITGGAFENYDPAFTHVAVRCADTEIARVPIRRPSAP
jgi:hypothetical protein